jgi:hypothetical protein
MSNIKKQALVQALERIVSTLERNPTSAVGMNVSVSGDGKGGNVTGVSVNVSGGQGSGDVTGMHISVSSGDPNPADIALIQALNESVQALRAENADQSLIDGLLSRARDLGNRALDAAIAAATKAAIAYYIGGGE